MTDQMRIAVPRPDSEGTHVIETPVEEIVRQGDIPEGRAMAILDESCAVVRPEQCFALSDHFNRVGEVLERYHNGGESDAE